MPLPITNLDDTTFQTMVTNAQSAIPQRAPEWTDYNLHDPGITFIDLFAWLTEMQQYYLNRIRDDNYLRFLQLLGVRPADPTPARADIVFTPKSGPVTVPQGTKLSTANGSVVFETLEPLPVVAATLQKVISISSSGTRDNSAANSSPGISYMAFGDNAEAGSALYLGFTSSESGQPFPANSSVALTIFLSENYPVPRGSHGNEAVAIIPSARIVWEYCNGPNSWQPLSLAAVLEPLLASLPSGSSGLCNNLQSQLLQSVQASLPFQPPLPAAAQSAITAAIQNANSTCDLRALATDPSLIALCRDETDMFSLSGRFFFTAPSDMSSTTLTSSDTQTCYWIRARVAAAGFELPPRINQILLNTVAAAQTNTYSEVNVFSSDGTAMQSFPASTYLSQQGAVEVQVQVSPGLWQQWSPQSVLDDSSSLNYVVSNNTLTFGDGGNVPPQGTGNIRLIAYPSTLQKGQFIGQGNGLPNQQFALGQTGVVPGTLLLQTTVNSSDNNPIWQDWVRVDNFDAAGPTDHQFVYDAVNTVVLFGDGVNGAVPPVNQAVSAASASGRNLRWIALQLTQGSQGNVTSISSTPPPFTGPANVTWHNVAAATGGADAETLAAAELRARRDLYVPYRAVTTGDFEYDAIQTPGLRVSRAHAIPLYDGSSGERGGNVVTVVVVPYSTALQPTPSKGFLQTVCRHLMMHRLITTKVVAIAPQYITVTVSATITLQAGALSTTVQQAAITALQQFLNPLTGGTSGQGWPFGRSVYFSDIEQLLDGVAGVNCVQTLTLSASGTGAAVTSGGDVTIPLESLVVSGNHSITVSTNSGVCPSSGGCQ